MTNGTFEPTSWDESDVSKVEDGARVAQFTMTAQHHGVIEGAGTAHAAMRYGADGSGVSLGYEQIVGSVSGKSGSFVMEQRSTYDAKGVRTTWEVVPGSGTAELTGLSGKGEWATPMGTSPIPYTFEYELPRGDSE